MFCVAQESQFCVDPGVSHAAISVHFGVSKTDIDKRHKKVSSSSETPHETREGKHLSPKLRQVEKTGAGGSRRWL